jgi:hypothetical protein
MHWEGFVVHWEVHREGFSRTDLYIESSKLYIGSFTGFTLSVTFV